eukprot:Hpha_TRINITY_DN26836_c0_g1::TRINITY_DN26836_c0_g1_i1::g.17226::m.17226
MGGEGHITNREEALGTETSGVEDAIQKKIMCKTGGGDESYNKLVLTELCLYVVIVCVRVSQSLRADVSSPAQISELRKQLRGHILPGALCLQLLLVSSTRPFGGAETAA